MFSLQFFKRIILLILFLGLSKTVFAKTKATVSPFIIEEKVFPGESFEREVTLTNESDQKLNFKVSIEDIKIDEKGNLSFPPANSEKFSLAEWINIEEKELELLPGQSKKFKIFFRIPEKNSAGSRHGAIIFASQSDLPSQQNEGIFASFSHQVGVLIFLYSTQDVKEEARILHFGSNKKYYFTPFLVKFQTQVENLGNVYLEPIGKIEVINFFGKKIGEIVFNQQRLKILPEGKRNFEEIWQGKKGFGKYTSILYLTFGTAQNQGGSGVKTIFAKTYFWIIPLKEIIFGFLIFILIGYLIIISIRRYKIVSQNFKNGK